MELEKVNLFNKDIPIRKYGCKHKEDDIKIINPPRLNLFIQLTQNCNANCNFCEYHKNCNYYTQISTNALILTRKNKLFIIILN